jgi:hypothetical protein
MVVPFEDAVHVIPSVEREMELVPCPVATQYVPFQATAYPDVVKTPAPVPAVHASPSVDQAMVLVPSPTATYKEPFQAILRQRVVKGEARADQVNPS